MILAHELDDFTMSEAMKFYPILREAFEVSFRLIMYHL